MGMSVSYQHFHDCLTDACLGTHHFEQEKLLEDLEHNNETTRKHIAELEEKQKNGAMHYKALQREVASMASIQAEEVKNQNDLDNVNTKQALELHTNDLRKAQAANAQAQARAAELQAKLSSTDATVQSLQAQVICPSFLLFILLIMDTLPDTPSHINPVLLLYMIAHATANVDDSWIIRSDGHQSQSGRVRRSIANGTTKKRRTRQSHSG